jgi:hypothetical protein
MKAVILALVLGFLAIPAQAHFHCDNKGNCKHTHDAGHH